jgi:hypothetical protein
VQAPASTANFPMLIYKYTQSLQPSTQSSCLRHHTATRCRVVVTVAVVAPPLRRMGHRGRGHGCCTAWGVAVVSRSRPRSLHHVGRRCRCCCAAWVSRWPLLHRRCTAWGVAVVVVAPRGASRLSSLCRVGVAVAVIVPCGCRGRSRCAAWSVAVGVVVPRGCHGRGRGRCATWGVAVVEGGIAPRAIACLNKLCTIIGRTSANSTTSAAPASTASCSAAWAPLRGAAPRPPSG